MQNIDTVAGTVTVVFYDASGNPTQPSTLTGGSGSSANPLSLSPGQSFEIVTASTSGLASGTYSVVLYATMRLGSIANVNGSGSINFNESYTAFSAGANPFYLPAITFNYFGWYSLISVQNVGSGPANVTVTITCLDGTTGTLTANNVAVNAAVHFDLFSTTPTGFSSSTSCNGSAVISTGGGGPSVVATDNQRIPTGGNMQSYDGVSSGANTLYIPALYQSYYGWNSSLNILKIGSGSTTVTVQFSDTGSKTCLLTDAIPSCQVYMPSVHPASPGSPFGATITASPSIPLVAVANAANGSQAQTYNGVDPSTATSAVGIPAVYKNYYGWNSSVTCQNIGSTATTLNVLYSGYAGNAYNTSSLSQGQTIEIRNFNESFLPTGARTGLTVSANAGGALISCIVNYNNPVQMGLTAGSWSMSTNALNQ